MAYNDWYRQNKQNLSSQNKENKNVGKGVAGYSGWYRNNGAQATVEPQSKLQLSTPDAVEQKDRNSIFSDLPLADGATLERYSAQKGNPYYDWVHADARKLAAADIMQADLMQSDMEQKLLLGSQLMEGYAKQLQELEPQTATDNMAVYRYNSILLRSRATLAAYEELADVYHQMFPGEGEALDQQIEYAERRNKDLNEKIENANAGDGTTADDVYAWAEESKQLEDSLRRLKADKENAEYQAYIADIMSRPDFEEGSKYHGTQNGKTPQIAPTKTGTVMYIETGYKDIMYDYINGIEDAIAKQDQNEIADGTKFAGASKRFLREMTPNEIAVYNYIYKYEGSEAAAAYTKRLEEDLNFRYGLKLAEEMKKANLIEAAIYGIYTGAEGWARNTAQAFSKEKLPVSYTQAAGQIAQKNMKGAAYYAYGAGNTVGNMLLPMLATAAFAGPGGAFGKVAAEVAGYTTMGASTYGNAYGAALRENRPEAQARSYAALIAASEIGLGKLLGGIGGQTGLADDVLLGKVAALDYTWERLVSSGAIRVATEEVEELSQLYVEPLIERLVFGEAYQLPTGQDITDTLVITALATLALESPNIAGVEIDYKQTGKMLLETASQQNILDFALEKCKDGSDAKKLALKLNAEAQGGKQISAADLGRLYTMAGAELVLGQEVQGEAPETVQPENMDGIQWAGNEAQISSESEAVPETSSEIPWANNTQQEKRTKKRTEEDRKRTEQKGFESERNIVAQQSEERQQYLRSQYEKHKDTIEGLKVGDKLFTNDGDFVAEVSQVGEYGVTILGEDLIERIPRGTFGQSTVVESILETGGYFTSDDTQSADIQDDPVQQLRQDYVDGRITEEEFDQAMDALMEEESASEMSMVDGIQWAGNEQATETAAEHQDNNTETEEMTYEEQRGQSAARDGARIGEYSDGETAQDRGRRAEEEAQRRSAERSQIQSDVKALGVPLTSLHECGLSIGSKIRSNRIIPQEAWTDSIQRAADIAAENGLEFVPLTGILCVEINGKRLRVEAVIKNGVIYVQADSIQRDVVEVTNHEVLHAKLKGDPDLQIRLVNHIKQNYRDEEISNLIDRYMDIYNEFVDGMTPEDMEVYVWQEMLADAYADLERFSGTEGPTKWGEYVRGEMAQAETKNTVQQDGAARMSAGTRSYSYEALTQKPPISVTFIDDRTIPTRGKKIRSQEIANAGREKAAVLYNDVRGKQRYVYVKDLDGDVLVPKKGFEHGIQGNKTNSSTMRTAEVTYDLVDILRNSIVVNELNARPGDDCDYSYILFGYAMNKEGDEYIVKSTVNHYPDNKSVVDSVEIYDVLKGSKAKNVASKVIGSHTGMPAARVLNAMDTTKVSVAELLDAVKENYPELLPDSVREHFGIQDLPKEPTARYSFAGEGAMTADEAALQMAKDMLDLGEDMETIRQETGWYQSRDGRWRFEIDDSSMTYHRGGDARFRRDHPEYARYQDLQMRFIEGTITAEEEAELRELHEIWGREYARLSARVGAGSATLGNILDHEELYAAYPGLRNMPVRFKDLDGAKGMVDHRRGVITLDNSLRNAPERTLLHEIQHAIQETEGFAKGSSPEYWENQGYEDAQDRYRNTAGEIEARDVANRRSLTAEERRQRMPDLGNEQTVFADRTQINDQAIGKTTDNRPFVEIKNDILAGVPAADWVTTVKENLKKKFPDEIVVGRNEINVDGQSRKELTYSGYMQWLYNNDPTLYADKLRATDNADEILIATTNWVNEGLKHPRKDRIVDFARGSVLLRIGGNDYSAEVVVGTRKNGTMLLYDVLQLKPVSFVAKETDAATSTNPSPGAARSTASVSGDATQELSRGVTVSGSLADTTSVASNDIISKDVDGVNTRFSAAASNEESTDSDTLPAKAQSYLRQTQWNLTNRIGDLMDVSFMTRRGSLRETVNRLANEYLQRGDVSQQTVDELFDVASGGRYDTDADAREQFEAAVYEALEELRQIRRYVEDRTAETSTAEPLTEENVKQLYAELKTARRTAEKAVAKNLLTAEDEVQIGRLLRGEITVDGLDAGQYNVKGIKTVYEARAEYERIAKQIRQWNQSRKAQLREDADTLLQTANDWKDKSAGLLYSRETMERNIRDIVKDPELAEQIIAEYFEPVHRGTAEANKLKNDYRSEVKKLNLNRKVEKGNVVSEAHAVQLLGEAEDNIQMLEQSKGRMKSRDGKTLEEWRGVVQALWENNPNLNEAKIRNAAEAFRKIYDELFVQMNEVRIRNGYEPINYRNGYFPHFQPGDGGIMALFGKALGIDTQVNALPTTINGLTHTFRPGITWFGNAQERLGFNTAYDAVEGFDRYIEGVADVIFHTDNIQRLRALASQIRYRTGDEGIRKQVDAVRADTTLAEQDKQNRIEKIYESGKYSLSNFVVELEEYTNLLANKKSRHDRDIESDVGRKIYTIVKNLESRVAANMVAVNPASWLTNFIPLTQGNAALEHGMLLRGMWHTLQAYKTDDGIVDMSSFLTNRRGSDPIVKSWQDRASGKLSAPMEYIDQFVADSLVRARYYQNLKHGMSEDAAMREADAWVAGVMADRSKGSMPTLFGRKNPMTKLFTQFQLEVNNQLSYVMKDVPRDMRSKGAMALVAALIKFCLGAFLFDELYEYLIGRRPALDPLGILNDTVGDLTGYELPNLVEMGVGAIKGEKPDFRTEKKGTYGAVSSLLGNVAEEMPFVGGLLGGGRIPISSALPDGENLLNAALNSEWDSEKRWKTAAKELGSSAAYLIPPFGGGQIKKIVETVQAVHNHGSYNASGNLQYPVFSDSPLDWAGSVTKGVLFGKSSLDPAVEWVESGFDGLSEKYTAVYQIMLELGEDDRTAWAVTKQLADAEATGEESVAVVRRDILREADISEETKLAIYYDICANDKEKALIESMGDEDPQVVYELLDGMRDAEKTEDNSEVEVERQMLRETDLPAEAKLEVYMESYASDKERAMIESLTEDDPEIIYEVVDGIKDAGNNTDKMIVLFTSDLRDNDKQTVLEYISESDGEKFAAAADYVDFDIYGRFLQSFVREYGYGSKSQDEVEYILDHTPGLSDQERAAIWQICNKGWKPKNNPYSVEVGQRIYDQMN